MDSNLHEWLNLLIRWFHVMAGVMWIGNSFYFMWLDSHLEKPENPDGPVTGELWAVHSGGFYRIQKTLLKPGELPKTLHWFKWEATFTWISGFVLLAVVYYLTDGAYLVDSSVSDLSPRAATGIGIGVLVAGWFVYDVLWRLLDSKRALAAAISFALLVGVAYALGSLFSGRGAFMHVGAMMGTLMVLNVWVHILPAQTAMIQATREGRKADYSLGMRAKMRSVHNSYMTLPVVFVMLSNHFPSTYSGPHGWIVLMVLTAAGAGIRHFMIVGTRARWALGVGIAAIASAFVITSPKAVLQTAGAEPVAFEKARAVIEARCLACHSSRNTDTVFTAAPNGVMFDSPEKIKSFVDRIKLRAVISKTMPLGNKTGMTDEERATLGRWIDQGAKTD